MSDGPKYLLIKNRVGETVASATLDDDKNYVVEFKIEDLIKDLVIEPGSPIAACNGCNACSKD